jgi:hypothetical protein
MQHFLCKQVGRFSWPRVVRAFVGDRRGASMATAAVVLPLLVMVVFGMVAIWRFLSVKQSMDAATYEAARYLSHEGVRIAEQFHSWDPEQWAAAAQQEIAWVDGEIRRNPFVAADSPVQIQVNPPAEINCSGAAGPAYNYARDPGAIRFTVTTVVNFDVPLEIPFVADPPSFTLRESHSELIECQRFLGRPPREGSIFFPRRN